MSRTASSSGRHRSPARRRRVALALGALAVIGAGAAIVVSVLDDGSAGASRAAATSTSSAPTPSAVPSTSRATSKPTTSSAGAPASTSPAAAALRALVRSRSSSSTSVAALDTATGATASAGAAKGMTTASAVKVQLLESLLLKHQRSGDDLSSGELASVTAMIEHSDNGAAEDVFFDVGGHEAVVDLEHDLGLSTKRTVMGDDDYWGLTTTSAAQQLILLRNLVDADGPLDAQSRALALRLMRNVEADQTWGVPAAATSGQPAVKNGWLNIDSDGGLWAVNSLGVITVDGHTVLIAVMTQHNDSYDAGKDRVRSLVSAAAAALR